jgi:methylated-DNA-[protein]-cysteine S-methyltransferase
MDQSVESIPYQSPVGILHLYATENGICGLAFEGNQDKTTLAFAQTEQGSTCDDARGFLDRAIGQLEEYFAGKREAFDLPLDVVSGTEYQQKVWSALRTIPYGETWTYGQLATATGNPRAARAVGGANNKNPIAIIVPCHRVIGASGSLVGFAGGVDIKQRLLDLESKGRSSSHSIRA